MTTKTIIWVSAIVCACCATFFLGRHFAQPGRGLDAGSLGLSNLLSESRIAPKDDQGIEKARAISDEDAVRIARDALIELDSNTLSESAVLSSGRYKLVSFRIWHNPHDPKPPGPDVWHSPVWIDAETGAIVPPQLPDWKPMTDVELKAFVMDWDPEMNGEEARNWNWDIRHVSGFARIVVRDPSPPSDNIWVEDDDPVAVEYWVDETRKAVICAHDL